MSSPGTLTLETCDDSRDDDNTWIQDWEFDDQDRQDWVRIEDDDDDSKFNFPGMRPEAKLMTRSMLDCVIGSVLQRRGSIDRRVMLK
jgi:hypothetical protein